MASSLFVSAQLSRGFLRSPRGPPTRREHRFLCQRKRWERKRRGGAAPSALPPMRNRAKFPLRWDFPGAVPFGRELPAYEGSVVLPCKTGDRKDWRSLPLIGAAPLKRPPFWRGVERGTRSSPLRLFFPRFLFREKKSGATRAGCPCGEHKSPRDWGSRLQTLDRNRPVFLLIGADTHANQMADLSREGAVVQLRQKLELFFGFLVKAHGNGSGLFHSNLLPNHGNTLDNSSQL